MGFAVRFIISKAEHGRLTQFLSKSISASSTVVGCRSSPPQLPPLEAEETLINFIRESKVIAD